MDTDPEWLCSALMASSRRPEVRSHPSILRGVGPSKISTATAASPPPPPPSHERLDTPSGNQPTPDPSEDVGPVVLIVSLHVCSSTLVTRSNTLPSRRTLKNSRLVCKKDDVHVCVMCLRAIMNYQVTHRCLIHSNAQRYICHAANCISNRSLI